MQNQSRILKWSLIAGLVIVINLFFGYSLSLVYKQPISNCSYPIEPATEQTASALSTPQFSWETGYKQTTPSETQIKQEEAFSACQSGYQTAENNYARNIFVALVILGILLVLIGNFMKGNAVIASGLALAGVLSFIIASVRYWSYASDYLHVGILAVALILLFWIAVKKFKNNSQ